MFQRVPAFLIVYIRIICIETLIARKGMPFSSIIYLRHFLSQWERTDDFELFKSREHVMLCARGYYYMQFVSISGLARGNIPNLYFAKKPKQVLPYG